MALDITSWIHENETLNFLNSDSFMPVCFLTQSGNCLFVSISKTEFSVLKKKLGKGFDIVIKEKQSILLFTSKISQFLKGPYI